VAYIPEAGDIVWLHLTPRAAHEQAGHRPALVVSPASCNRIGLMLCCLLTTRVEGYPFEVAIASDGPGNAPSVALADRIESLDWRAWQAKRRGRATEAELAAVRARAVALIRGR
jgi:mRNA interferase MazF